KRPTLPKGAGLFGDHGPVRKPTAAFKANIDGGSRGNPGPAAYVAVVRDARGEVVVRLKKYIGQNTNNVAEYYGLIAALDYAQTHGIRALRIESDSELLVKQMRGQYKVKSGDLRPLFERARKMAQALNPFALITFTASKIAKPTPWRIRRWTKRQSPLAALRKPLKMRRPSLPRSAASPATRMESCSLKSRSTCPTARTWKSCCACGSRRATLVDVGRTPAV